MTNMLPPYTTRLGLNGPDTIAMLERLITCRVDDMATGDQCPGALLTPQGKIIADFHLIRTELGCDLLVHADAATDLEKRLKMFRLRADVQITREDLPATATDDLARLKAGLPVFGADFITADVFPTDVNLDIRGGIDYKKGCFVGQEVVSRMKRRGKIRKRTLTLTGAGLQQGDTVQAGDKRLGTITSSAQTHALAVMRIDHLAAALSLGETLTCNAKPVSVETPDWVICEMEALSTNVDT